MHRRAFSSNNLELKVSLQLLTKLRKETSFSLAKARAALIHSKNDYDSALVFLNSQQPSTKLASRHTRQGTISLLTTAQTSIMVELNCETDFVARNAAFTKLAGSILQSTFLLRETNVPIVLDAPSFEDPGQTIHQTLKNSINKLGENIVLRRIAFLSNNAGHRAFLGAFVHSGMHDTKGTGRIAGMVKIGIDYQGKHSDFVLVKRVDDVFSQIANRIARHIVAIGPKDTIELEAQELFAGEDGIHVADYVGNAGRDLGVIATIDSMIRYEVGEFIEGDNIDAVAARSDQISEAERI